MNVNSEEGAIDWGCNIGRSMLNKDDDDDDDDDIAYINIWRY